MTDVRWMDIKEFRERGFLQEANRLFFHPLGLALATVTDEDGTERLAGVWDARDDPEGWIFADGVDPAKAARVAVLAESKADARRVLFDGDTIQPLP